MDVPRADLENGIPAFELLRRANLAKTNGEARRLIKGGGGRLNGTVITDETRLVGLADLTGEGVILSLIHISEPTRPY